MVDWPFPVEGDAPAPQLRVKVLGQDAMEAANIEAMDYFREIKAKVVTKDDVFVARERICLVWRAYSDMDGEALAPTSADLAKLPDGILAHLYAEWSRYQAEVAAHPLNQKQMDALVESLKKNIDTDLLPGLPTSWLIGLITTLASQLAALTTANELG